MATTVTLQTRIPAERFVEIVDRGAAEVRRRCNHATRNCDRLVAMYTTVHYNGETVVQSDFEERTGLEDEVLLVVWQLTLTELLTRLRVESAGEMMAP